ncbi:MAG TPA: hypothetical protein ENH32_04930 [Proteobacteria bacterium]|nr:hypothetical protein BMS3Abin14_00949 [bacterium BMS3Abin14]HDL53299.1 hypothetical protein [Pseudomonadota bacterium]
MSRFINSVFILRNLIGFAAATLTACFIAYSILYWTLSRNLGESYRGAFYLMKTLREGAGPVVWFAVTLYGIVISIFILAIALFATHKVAGPLYRLEMVLGLAMRGELPESVHFRTRDQMVPLAESIGGLISVLRRKEIVLMEMAEEIRSARDELDGKINAKDPGWVDLAAGVKEMLLSLSVAARSGRGEIIDGR